MHKATPGTFRSLRQIAEKHVQPSNMLPAAEGLDVQAGVPAVASGGTAKPDEHHVRGPGAPAPASKTPFTLGGK